MEKDPSHGTCGAGASELQVFRRLHRDCERKCFTGRLRMMNGAAPVATVPQTPGVTAVAPPGTAPGTVVIAMD